MSVDLRGFVYSAEPIRRKRGWELDAAQAALGAAQRELDSAQQLLDKVEQSFDAMAGHIREATRSRFDAVSHQRSLEYLGSLQRRIDSQRTTVSELRLRRNAAKQKVILKQQEMDLTKAHRDACIAEYRVEQGNRSAAAADRDWTARTVWKSAQDELGTTMQRHKGNL